MACKENSFSTVAFFSKYFDFKSCFELIDLFVSNPLAIDNGSTMIPTYSHLNFKLLIYFPFSQFTYVLIKIIFSVVVVTLIYYDGWYFITIK
jgi:hypothetical protein